MLTLLLKLNLAGDHTVTWHEEVVLAPRVPSYGVVLGEAQVKKRQGYQASFQWLEMECSALGFSYVPGKPRNGQLAKMGYFHQSKRSDNM